MKHRVISILMILLLLIVPAATGVFAVEGGEEPVSTVTASTETHAAEAEAEAGQEAPPETEAEPEPQPSGQETEAQAPEEETEPQTPGQDPDAQPSESAPVTASDPKLCRLTVRVEREKEAEKQSFLFTLRGSGVSLQLAIPADSSEITVSGLQAGIYTVTEERSWSWRFDSDAEEELVQSVELSDAEDHQTVSFRPIAGESPWLSDCAGGEGR